MAGYLGGLKSLCFLDSGPSCNYGCLYGFVAWSLALILTIFLSASAGKFMVFTMATLNNPTVAVEKYAYSNANITESTTVQTTAMMHENRAMPVQITKTFTITAFVAFILFLVGAITASVAGHFAFECCARRHGIQLE